MPTIMIVDDDRTTVALLQALLELDGFKVVLAPRGSMVIERAQAESPDVFLVDYHLADMEGTQVIKVLRQNPRFATTPIVMTSGLNVEDEARQAGAQVFLPKPFDPANLAELFNKLIAQASK